MMGTGGWRGAAADFKNDRVLMAAGVMALVGIGIFIYRLFTLWP
jgi:hypothetical protein